MGIFILNEIISVVLLQRQIKMRQNPYFLGKYRIAIFILLQVVIFGLTSVN